MFKRLPNCLVHIIAQYVIPKPTRFKSFINPNKIDWYHFSVNPAAISLLEKNPDKICWGTLSENPSAISILEKNLDKINWNCFSGNPAAISILEKNINKIDWYFLSGNFAAIPLLEKNREKITNWSSIFRNPNIFEIDIEQYKKDLNTWLDHIRV